MTLPRLQLSVIGDEIGSSLDEMISFAHEHGLTRLDMRTVGGRNLLAMKTEEVIEISRTLEKAGIMVPAFVSPLFKWPAPRIGTTIGRAKVDFAFDPTQCPSEDWLAQAMQIAVIQGAPGMNMMGTQIIGKFLCRWIDDVRFAPQSRSSRTCNVDPETCRSFRQRLDGRVGTKPALPDAHLIDGFR